MTAEHARAATISVRGIAEVIAAASALPAAAATVATATPSR